MRVIRVRSGHQRHKGLRVPGAARPAPEPVSGGGSRSGFHLFLTSFENLILMCPNHHQEVDDLDPERYPVELLSDMKNRSMEGAGDWTTIQELDRMAGQMIQKLAYLDVAEDAKLEARSAP